MHPCLQEEISNPPLFRTFVIVSYRFTHTVKFKLKAFISLIYLFVIPNCFNILRNAFLFMESEAYTESIEFLYNFKFALAICSSVILKVLIRSIQYLLGRKFTWLSRSISLICALQCFCHSSAVTQSATISL